MEERTIQYMQQGTVNGQKTRQARHLERIEAERRYGRILACMALLGGILIGCFITMIAQNAVL